MQLCLEGGTKYFILYLQYKQNNETFVWGSDVVQFILSDGGDGRRLGGAAENELHLQHLYIVESLAQLVGH
jgi:hypothetical protein